MKAAIRGLVRLSRDLNCLFSLTLLRTKSRLWFVWKRSAAMPAVV